MFVKLWLVHDDIDVLPIRTWFKVNNDQSFESLIKKRSFLIPKSYLVECWFNIMDQYVSIFGINDNYEKILKTKQKLILAKIDFAISNDRSILNFIKIYEAELESLHIPETKEDEYELIASVEKYVGYKIDESTYSARKFFNHIIAAQKEAEMMEAKKNKKK